MADLPEYQYGHHLRPPEMWTLTLNRYQRDNLLWLLQACGYGNPGVEPFTCANTGDWIGEIHNMLGAETGYPVTVTFVPRRPNVSFDNLRERVAYWLDRQASGDG